VRVDDLECFMSGGTSAEQIDSLRCDLAGEVLRNSGALRVKALGWSMVPSILPGDTVFISNCGITEVDRGDIVLFSREQRFFIHRVITIDDCGDQQMLATRGDAMPHNDPPVRASELLGKVEHIIRNGKLIRPARTPGLAGRAASAMARRSQFAARVIVGLQQLQVAGKQE